MYRLSLALGMGAVTCALTARTAIGQAARPGPTVPAPANTVVHLDGLDIDFDTAGNWIRLYSTYRQPVAIADRQGLRDAYTIAEEKGKAQVIRYLDQNVSSERLVTQVDQTTQNTIQAQGTRGEGFSKVAQREMVESIKEFTRSFSEGTLRGVNIVEQGYDAKAQEVWVKIGLTRGDVRTANQIRNAMNDTTTGSDHSGAKHDSTSGRIPTQGSEVRTRPAQPR